MATAPLKMHCQPQSLVTGKIIHHHLDSSQSPHNPNTRPRSHKRWSSPAGFTQYPISLASTSSSTLVSDHTTSRRYTPELPQIESGDGTSDSATSLLDDLSLSDPNKLVKFGRRTSLADKIPGMKMFKMRSKKGKENASTPGSSCSSTPLSMSPMSSPSQRFKDLEPDLEGFSSPKAESPKPIFTAPFKFRPKRASATATMSAAYISMEKPALYRSCTDTSLTPPASPDKMFEKSLPSDPSSTQIRKKRFSSILSLNLSNTIPVALGAKSASGTPSSTTPSRRSFTSPFNILTPTNRKTPQTPAPRTQPYGYPYFARMPNGDVAIPPSPLTKPSKAEKALHRSSLDESILECKEPEADSPQTAKATNALGLSMQQQIVSPRGHRRMVSDSAIGA
ncbi:hypothetical protein QCA50_002294 [Cerrena zonata]|uniref:Uncharacterized protein n=1 Tax=Cerrena zonata TaxID=2478898 RepID=A0AAW0GV89_9APHY